MFSCRNKSITLVELLIALVLVSIIVLGLGSIDTFSREQLVSASRRAQLQNELSYCLEHMTRNISRAIGDASAAGDPLGWYADNRGVRVRIDDNPANGRIDGTDTWIGYRHEGNQILYFPSDPDGTHSLASEVIASHILTTNLAAADTTWGLVLTPLAVNNLEIIVRGRWNPAVAASPSNPEVSMQTSVLMPSVSTH